MTYKYKYACISLYNHMELRKKLGLDKRCSFKDIIRSGLEEKGEDFLGDINGDFAFALYNSHTKETIAARDPIGIKALYYIVLDGQYYFSDSMDDFFKLKTFRKKPNKESMRSLLHHGNINYEETMYENIQRIPPGHYLKVIGNRHTLHRYWFPEKIDIDYAISMESSAKKFSELFEQAVERRIDTYEETAFELSGGLDSSSVVSLMKTKYPDRKIDTYSMYFNKMPCDENDYVESIEKKFDFSSNKINVADLDYRDHFNFKFNYMINPHWPITTTFTMYFPMLEKMVADNKRVIITGQGGDHLLEGSCCTVSDLMERKRWTASVIELCFLPLSPLSFNKSCILPFAVRNFLKRSKHFLISNKVSKNPKAYFDTSPSCTQNNKISKLISSAESTMLDSNLFHAAEKHYNIEFRHPFFDKELIEFTLSLPPEHTYSQGWTKVLLRYALHGILPEKILSRSDKAEFSQVIREQIDASGMLEMMQTSQLARMNIIKQSTIDEWIKLYRTNKTQNLLDLWSMVNMEFWYNYHFSSDETDKFSL